MKVSIPGVAANSEECLDGVSGACCAEGTGHEIGRLVRELLHRQWRDYSAFFQRQQAGQGGTCGSPEGVS